MDISMEIMRRNGVQVDCIRAVDHKIATGVWPDMTEHGWEADEWPAIFERVIAADILVIGTSIWLGEKSSVATQVIERLYGNSHLLNDAGQYAYYGRVGGCLVTGNEDGDGVARTRTWNRRFWRPGTNQREPLWKAKNPGRRAQANSRR
jgi:multimeric flavodoxin WrbA